MTVITTAEIMCIVNSSYAAATSQSCAVQTAVNVPLIATTEKEEQQQERMNTILASVESNQSILLPSAIPAIHGWSNNVVNSSVNTTTYASLFGAGSYDTTEVNSQLIYRTAGRFSNLWLMLSFNTVGGTSTFTFMKNTVAGNQVVSVGASATGKFEEVTHSDNIVAGDKIDIKFVPGAATGTHTMTACSMLFLPSTAALTSSKLSFEQSADLTGGSVTSYFPLSGTNDNALASQTTETSGKVNIGTAGTFRNLAIKILANTCNSASTMTMRKNGSDANLTLSIGSTATGIFEDLTHSDSVAVGDDYYNKIITGGTGAQLLSVVYHAVEFENTMLTGLLSTGSTGGQVFNTSTTIPLGISNSLAGGLNETTEVNLKSRISWPVNFSQMTVWVLTNAITAASTFTFRKNAANGNQTVSITASTTGAFTDTTNTDSSIGAPDLINYRLVTGATGTTMTIASTSISYAFALAVPPVSIEPVTIPLYLQPVFNEWIAV